MQFIANGTTGTHWCLCPAHTAQRLGMHLGQVSSPLQRIHTYTHTQNCECQIDLNACFCEHRDRAHSTQDRGANWQLSCCEETVLTVPVSTVLLSGPILSILRENSSFHQNEAGFVYSFPWGHVTSHLYEASRMEAFPGGIHGPRVLTLAVGRFPLLTLAFPFKSTMCAAVCHWLLSSRLHCVRIGVNY